MNIKLCNVVAIVNDGFSDKVMEIATEIGARGGTIISANGSVTSDAAMQLYGLAIHPEKEIVLILVNDAIVERILGALYDKLGNDSEARGIFFSLPVSHVSDNILNQYKKKKDTKE
ncbi:MAG: hypothetical protein PUA56_03110 [Bacillales bacterium]|nr:hypothetical protein [Bacillales bacterium]